MDEITSEEYEDKAHAALGEGDTALAQVLASLAIAAALRETGDVVAEAFDVSLNEDLDGDGEEADGEEDGDGDVDSDAA
jgi:hypothetical protein